MAAPAKDPITCHVLDTTTGRPAAKIAVKLVCSALPNASFNGETNADGRIMNWSLSREEMEDLLHSTNLGTVSDVLQWTIKRHAQQTATTSCPVGSSIWKLEFDTGSYYGAANTFFPKVELTFLVKEGEHFHVPLLLGPYSFTTYRGS
jgi:5-hydroxyisourate hydrolase